MQIWASLMTLEVKVAQLCLTLCDPIDLVHGILQARMLEWAAFPSSMDLLDPGLLHYRLILYQQCHQGSPKEPQELINLIDLQAEYFTEDLKSW